MRSWLITLRNEQKMTAQEVADKLGVSGAYYSMIENGKRQKSMDITLVSKLAEIFGVSIQHIINLERDYQSTVGNIA